MKRSGTSDHLLRGTLDLLILQALDSGSLHGYGIARRVEQATDDALRVEEGSLYPALHRLEDAGAIIGKWTKTEVGRRVRLYTLTRTGRTRLRTKRREWSVFASAVTRMVGGE